MEDLRVERCGDEVLLHVRLSALDNPEVTEGSVIVALPIPEGPRELIAALVEAMNP